MLGAGCSMEERTGLRLSSDYAEDAHDRLVLDGAPIWVRHLRAAAQPVTAVDSGDGDARRGPKR